jgi:acetyl/propionyl-CoA carboxylase alpha subunit
MIAKLIAHGATREAAVTQLAEACAAVEVWPVKTNAGFLARTLDAPDFREAQVETSFIDAHLEALAIPPPPSSAAKASAAAALAARDDDSPWDAGELAGFRAGAPRAIALMQCGDEQVEAVFDPTVRAAEVTADGSALVFEGGEAYVFSRPRAALADDAAAGDGKVTAPMPGRVTSLAVAKGAAVRKGQTLATLEAMKMEHALVAAFDGTVAEVRGAVGDQVVEGQLLLRLEPNAE